MKTVSKILKWLIYTIIALVLLVNIVILVTGRHYLYKTLANTVLKGRLNPSIDEYGIFPNRKVNIGTPMPWAIGKDYNKQTIPQKYLNVMKKLQTVSYLIVKNDSLRYEQYWDGYSDTSHTNSFSMGKSITSILCGIAIADGKIKSVDEKVSDFIPEFKQGMDSLLTIKDLLTMSSGMNWVENYINPFAYPAEAYYSDDLMKVTLKYKVTSTPGKEFIYQSGNSTLLGYIITKATGKSLSDYASEKLWQPLGAEQPAYWSVDHQGGMEKAYCCFNSNARDFARLGQLYLDSGKWRDHLETFPPNDQEVVNTDSGKTHITWNLTPVTKWVYKQVVPKDYVMASMSAKLVPYYGYNWWILRCEGHTIPYCRGILGQYIFVIPDLNMVVVRLGKKRGPVETKTIDGKEYNIPMDAIPYLKAAIEMYGK
ncbi:MAG TPA: serine hydrolase [Bacteroidia bacterium]|nr:serine hydrolase [Bacteroidia bacterium]